MKSWKSVTWADAAVVLGVVVAVAACSESTSNPDRVQYFANLTGGAEVPATTSTATGSAAFELRGGDTLIYAINAQNLSKAATASHIHVGSKTEAGGVVNGFAINANVTSGTIASGTIVLSKLVAAGTTQISGDSLLKLLNNGNAYVNVHTSTFPSGEIRGQIGRQ